MNVEIWSDVTCPWCYVGKRRFETALARFPHRDEVTLTWRSFELNPDAPARLTGSSVDRLAAKYGMSREQARASNARLGLIGMQEGLVFKFEETQSGNTRDAHRLLHLAAERGIQDQVKERLFKAYFSESEPIGDPETLVRLVAEAGLDSEEARAVLAGDDYREQVRSDEQEAIDFGINGVPFFVFDRHYGISGAQSADILLQGLTQAWADAHPIATLTQIGGDGEACDGDACAIRHDHAEATVAP